MSDYVLLNVFFEGTANTLDPITTQVGIFYRACAGQDLSFYSRKGGMRLDPGAGPFKVAFDGCGVTHGLSGTLFASGLEGQCELCCAIVEDLMAAGAAGVRCNCLGLSRGGLALMILAQQFGALPPDSVARVELNMVLFDPVPGNLVSTGFPFTGLGRADLTGCNCLKRVLAIYPHEPLPDLSFHAPVLCKYPSAARVEEIVTLGCHQVLSAPDAKQAAGRDEYCPPYKTARWGEFLVFVVGASKAKELTGGASGAAPVSPVRSMRKLPESNVYSPRTRPPAAATAGGPGSSPPTSPPRSPRAGGVSKTKSSKSVRVVKKDDTSLDYIALAAMGVLIAVVAVCCSKDAMELLDTELNKMVKYAVTTLKVDKSVVDWFVKVFTVGGTLALSGGAIGTAIMFLATVVAFAIFANKK